MAWQFDAAHTSHRADTYLPNTLSDASDKLKRWYSRCVLGRPYRAVNAGRPPGRTLTGTTAKEIRETIVFLRDEYLDDDGRIPRQRDVADHYHVSRSTLLRHLKALGVEWKTLTSETWEPIGKPSSNF